MKKICYVPWQGTPKNDQIFKTDVGNWEFALSEKLKKENIEIHTDDVLDIKDADGCVFFDNIFYKNLDAMWELYNNRLLDKSVYIDYEPPTGHCKNHDEKGIKELSKIFKKVITYNDDLVDGKRIIKGNIANFYSKKIENKVSFKDKKFITMITSNVENSSIISQLNYYNNTVYYNSNNTKMHPNSIYDKRKEAADYFMKKCPDNFDLYGALWPQKYECVLKGFLDKKDKCKTLSKYKFIISYDSYINQNGYISEKIFDSFLAGTVPVYWGASNVTDYIPKECFIDKRDFETYDELYDFLSSMTEEQYEKYLKAIDKFLKSENFKKYFSSEASANIIKDALFSKEDNFSYEEAYKALMYFQNKRDKVLEKESINYSINELKKSGELKLQLEFNYNLSKNKIYEIYINGKKNKELIVDKLKPDNNQICKEIVNVSNTLFIKNKSNNKKVILFDYSNKEGIDNGVVYKKRLKTIKYYNYNNMSKLGKLFYVIRYNRPKLYDMIRNKVRK